jgi:hypothetical protein
MNCDACGKHMTTSVEVDGGIKLLYFWICHDCVEAGGAIKKCHENLVVEGKIELFMLAKKETKNDQKFDLSLYFSGFPDDPVPEPRETVTLQVLKHKAVVMKLGQMSFPLGKDLMVTRVLLSDKDTALKTALKPRVVYLDADGKVEKTDEDIENLLLKCLENDGLEKFEKFMAKVFKGESNPRKEKYKAILKKVLDDMTEEVEVVVTKVEV